jgi:hypothetical protein
MSVATVAKAVAWWSGDGRVGDLAADDPDGCLELDRIRVDAGAGGSGADQGADRVVGQRPQVSSSPCPGTPTAPGQGRAGGVVPNAARSVRHATVIPGQAEQEAAAAAQRAVEIGVTRRTLLGLAKTMREDVAAGKKDFTQA